MAGTKEFGITGALKNVSEDTTPQLGGDLDTNAHQIRWSKGSDVASAGALELGTDGNYFDITGSTAITSIKTLAIGTVVILHFDDELVLTHHATDLILPGSKDITTATGDEAIFVEYATGDWRCVSYSPAVGYERSTSAYGVYWDEGDPSPTLTRTGNLAGTVGGTSPGNANLPIQALMRRCILNDSGEVVYYLGATDSTKKEDMETASNLDGTDGQVMVEIPKFWYKYEYASNVHSWSISDVYLSGYELHPAFYKDGAWVDYRYIGAYEGVGYDNGTTAYFDGDDVSDTKTQWPGGTAIDTANDKLGSVSGFAPLMNETRAEFRAIALNRGTGWRQQDFYLVSAIQLLYLVEYASWNSQSVIGMGRTELTGGTWAKDSYIGVTGKSNSAGNVTTNVGGNTNNAYMSYRGIENFYGNVWKWVDGFNINNNIPYVSNIESDFADDTTTDYYRLEDTGESGITLPSSNDYQKTLEQIKDGFLPSAGGGSSATYITDYYYQDSGWRVAKLGGAADSGLLAGVADWYLNSSSAVGNVHVGGRLCF